MGIKRLKGLNLPYLRYADLVGNDISEADAIHEMFENSRYLEVLDISSNPLCKHPDANLQVIASCPTVWNLCGQAVSTEDRYACCCCCCRRGGTHAVLA